MSRPGWIPDFIKLVFPKDYRRWAPFLAPAPVANMVRKAMFDGDHMYCVPRDETVLSSRVIEVDAELDPGEQIVLPSQLCDYFIDRMDYHVVMDFCLCRRSMDCVDYPIEYGCLFMGEAARGINPEWGRQVSKAEAKAHIRKCQEAGLIHFMGKSKLDTLWLGVGPGHKLMTICNCCPCCCITRGLAHFPEQIAESLHRAPGVEVTVSDDCSGCGSCTAVCFAHAIELDGEQATISDACRGCGRCVEHCPEAAVHIDIDVDRFIAEAEQTIARIIDLPAERSE
jgi:ferredoxin